MRKVLLKNATAITSSRIIHTDILIEDKFIAKIDKDITQPDAKVIECKDKLVIPGAIDAHVHFREPGFTQKATIASESAAAALGGVTSFMDMPNTNPATCSLELLEQKRALANNSSYINYSFHLGANGQNIDEIKNVDIKKVPSIKVYMGATTGNLLVEQSEFLYEIFKNSPIMITTHCEDNNVIVRNEKKFKAIYNDDIPFIAHPMIRDREACLNSSKFAIQMALDTNAKLHIMHISTKDEINLLAHFNKGDIQDRQISAEACIPHLFFSDSFYESKKGFLKCNPAIKTEFDRLAIIEGIKKGVITTIGTDHAPHERESKQKSYLQCPSGLPSIQYSLLSLFDLWRRKEISLEQIVRLTSVNVAKRYNIINRGDIQEGYFADIAIVDILNSHHVNIDDIQSICKWSPFEDFTFRSSITHTIVNGHIVVEDGRLMPRAEVMGLEYNR